MQYIAMASRGSLPVRPYLFWDGFCMRNKTIKDFYYGKLAPVNRQMIEGSEVSRVVAELAEIEELLLETAGEAAAPLLKRYEKALSTLDSITAEVNYIDGFKTGARFMMEILDDTHENVEPIRESERLDSGNTSC